MTYLAWYEAQAARHKAVVTKLLARGLERDAIIAYFDFDNMVEQEPDFCPLYREKNADGTIGRRCHAMEKLNCYLCACPNFRFNDEGVTKKAGKTRYSFCAIDSPEGAQGHYGDAIHQDCSNCTVPHHVSYVKRHFDTDWKKIMKNCRFSKPVITKS